MLDDDVDDDDGANIPCCWSKSQKTWTNRPRQAARWGSLLVVLLAMDPLSYPKSIPCHTKKVASIKEREELSLSSSLSSSLSPWS